MGITVNCNEELCPVLRPTPDLKPNTTPAPETTAAPKAGVSLKEYQKQLDIFKKSIDVQSHDMVKLKALLGKVQGDLSEEKTEREKSDQTEKEKRRLSENSQTKRLKDVSIHWKLQLCGFALRTLIV